jgi:hypothetical protein
MPDLHANTEQVEVTSRVFPALNELLATPFNSSSHCVTPTAGVIFDKSLGQVDMIVRTLGPQAERRRHQEVSLRRTVPFQGECIPPPRYGRHDFERAIT